MNVRPYWVAGSPVVDEVGAKPVVHPYDGRVAGSIADASAADVEKAVAAAWQCADDFAALPAWRRADALEVVAQELARRGEEMAQLITAENGKPIRWSRVEVRRAVSTFRWAAAEARRWSGELMRLDTDPGSEGRMGMVTRVPRGPVLGIAPFNFPLNLVVHKVAPALAIGAPIIVKPAPATPLSASLLGEILAAADLPAGSWSVLPMSNAAAAELVLDSRLPVVSFTGSGPVGWGIQDAVPRKHVTLELGGNAAAVVCADWSSPSDLDLAAARLATFSMYQAGQSCISVQRVLVHTSLRDRLVAKVVERVRALGVGDPLEEATEVGPLVDEAAARRVESWIGEAVAAGATVLTGGGRDGATVEPTVLVDVPDTAKVSCEEAFGPVLVLSFFDDPGEAFAKVNQSRYGLQAGVFTHDLQVAFQAHRTLRVGGVVIGDVPSFRADQMPYGGVKDSGVGREGVVYAMEDLSEPRLLVLTGLDR